MRRCLTTGWKVLIQRESWQALFVLAASATACFAELRVEPAQVVLYPNGTQQLVVSDDEVEQVDATSITAYNIQATEVANVSATGLVRATVAGETELHINHRGQHLSIPVRVLPSSLEPDVSFVTDVVPIFTKLGCNSGGCHGKATGQNGFKLSLLGFEPEFDYQALMHEARGRRLCLSAPAQSLLLRKAVSGVPHGGGRRLDVGSDDYRILEKWVGHGAQPPAIDDPRLERITLYPQRRSLRAQGRQQLLVTAHFSDGSHRDVTRQAVYESNQTDVAEVDADGVITAHADQGLFSVMIRFGAQVATFHGWIPWQTDEATDLQQRLAEIERQVKDSEVDRHLVSQWRRMRILPSTLASDATFIRRVSIDICGTLPTAAEVEAYVSNSSERKREELIDRLLLRPEHASYFALKWADILQNRGAGYSTSKQRAGTALFTGWIRDAILENKPYDRFVTEIITASGGQQENPPTLWYRSIRTLPEYVESVAQAFLGVRIQCARCHHHPFDRWSQGDYYGLAAAFSRVGRKGGFADAEVPTNETIYLLDEGTVYHPRTQALVKPRPLGGPDFELTRYDDPRRALADWMTRPENPYFAQTMVNRLWAHFMGQGIIHPIDDARSTNPPSNPELLAALSREFVSSGYDVRQLIRTICNSYAYRLSSHPDPNAVDTQTFARYYPRRLSAEVLLDGISDVLAVPTQFSGGPGAFPVGTRAIDLPDENVPAKFLDVFGRPARTTACECERIDAPTLGQALALVNSEEIQSKLTAEDGYVQSLVTNGASCAENIDDLFLRTYARRATPQEMEMAKQFLEAESDQAGAYGSLIWALLASNEFLFNH